VDNELYAYSPITQRPALSWPGGARVAFYLGLNIEHYRVDAPSTSIFPGTAGLAPDPLNYGWRDYGPRVGIWRMVESLDRHGLRASVLLNSEVARHYPQIIEAGRERDWAWLAHGRDNSTFQAGMSEDDERTYLQDVVSTIEAATGQHPKGWLGPALTETFNTPRLLAELGLSYVLDWCADDQPFPLNVPGHRFLNVPYGIDFNDVTLFVGKSLSGPDFYQIVVDQLDQLYADGEQAGRVMALPVHPFIVGQPYRHKYLDKALEYIAGHEGVWCTTSDEIADYYLENVLGPEATADASA
jgi:peptidoglycan/xylan/chitin deacetylase (PgdA/CDA1 family)